MTSVEEAEKPKKRKSSSKLSSVEPAHVRSRIMAAMLKERHRTEAAGLANAYQRSTLSAFLASDLLRIGVYDDGESLNDELARQYEIHVLPMTDLSRPLPRPPPSTTG